MSQDIRKQLEIPASCVDEINTLLLDPNNRAVSAFMEVVEKYGTPEEINRKAAEARQLPNLMARLQEVNPAYVDDLKWLEEQRDQGAFITVADYRRQVLGDRADAMTFDERFAVALEISALQYFPFLIEEAKQSIEQRELMPGRFIRVRKMKEQEADGDVLAVAAAMQIVGASYVETLDTKGTDGSNIHLGGPETITGYFGGVGQPNDHALKWLDEFLYYYTTYGVKQVLNINPGTVFLGYLLYKLGVDNEFKISVFMGNDKSLRCPVDADRGQTLLPARRHQPADRLQLVELGQQRDDGDHGPDPARPGFRGRGPFRAPHHRDLQVHRHSTLRPARRAGGDRRSCGQHLGQTRGRRPGAGQKPRPSVRHPGLLP
jgi:hypothetical protein